MNTTALIILCAISLLLNLILVLYVRRLIHWLRYWRSQYIGAVSPINPVPEDAYWEEVPD